MPGDINNLSDLTGVNSETTNTIIPEIDINNPLIFTPSYESLSVPITQLNNLDNIIIPENLPIYEPTVDISTDESVDTLTGEAIGQVINQAVVEGHQYLQGFAANPEFEAKMDLAFGENWNKQANISLPEISVISSTEINGANGAFAEATNTVYLSKEFLAQNLENIGEVTDVWLEEFGHYIDSQINIVDAVGDEGAIFSAVVQGKDLSEADIEALKGEDDKAVVVIDGLPTFVEKSSSWETYVGVWSSRTEIDWLAKLDTYSLRDNGVDFNFGSGSPGEGLPSDEFVMITYTDTFFEAGQDYTFKMRADDYFQLYIRPEGGSWTQITSGWQQAYGDPEEYYFTPSSNGQHRVLAIMHEDQGDAYLDVSWQETNLNFSVEKLARGVSLLEDESGNYVQIVDLSKGASVELRTSEDIGVGSNDSPKFARESIENAWNSFSADEPFAFSISNGAFFNTLTYEVAYPIKIGSTVYEGYGSSEPFPKRKLEIWNSDSRVEISDYDNNPDSVRRSSAPMAIVGLREDADKGIQSNVSRTFVGIRDRDGDGESETVLILNSKANTQPAAAQILRDFGAEEVMMLDGGGSTQMMTQDNLYVESTDNPDRSIPQTIGVTALGLQLVR
ncbi:MAG: phosphodiester glycosidase family protein [Xenococcus sp. (in: cyanobacteria)]